MYELIHSKVELIPSDEFERITNYLTNLSIGSHIINGKLEAYTSRYCKPTFHRKHRDSFSIPSGSPTDPPPPGSYRATGMIFDKDSSVDVPPQGRERSKSITIDIEGDLKPVPLISSFSEPSQNNLGLPFLLSDDPSSLPCNNKDVADSITKEIILHQNLSNPSSTNVTNNKIVSGGMTSITNSSVRERSHSISSSYVVSRRNSFSNDSHFNGLNVNDLSVIFSNPVPPPPNKRRLRASSLNDLSHPLESEIILNDFIFALNLSNPDYDFFPITTKKNFVLENLTQCMMNVNHNLSDLSNVSSNFSDNNNIGFDSKNPSNLPIEVHQTLSSNNNNNDKFLESLWSNIHEVINLKTCEIYRYSHRVSSNSFDFPNDNHSNTNLNSSSIPITSSNYNENDEVCDDSDDDSSVIVWEFFYFFFNRDLSTFVLFSCRAKSAIRVMMKRNFSLMNATQKRKDKKLKKRLKSKNIDISTTPNNATDICSIQNNIIDLEVPVSENDFDSNEDDLSDFESNAEDEDDEDEQKVGKKKRKKKRRSNSFSYDNSIGVLAAASDDEDLEDEEDNADPEKLVDEYEEIQEKLERRARRYSQSYFDEDEDD